ncbi:MAG: hypothetical protein Q8Q09_07730 [Deltaproteobacteria bacterium]|nr:hypothetical protein [Deltaproteobacteria bacterium]
MAAKKSKQGEKAETLENEVDVRTWTDGTWSAQVIKNEDDVGWAVAMYLTGQDEPALVGPWTMGRDKKNPKPLSQDAFNTLVKTASEVLQRHAQQRRAQLHREVDVQNRDGSWIKVSLDIVPDEDDPHAILQAECAGEKLGMARVMPHFKLSAKSAEKWIGNNYGDPG